MMGEPALRPSSLAGAAEGSQTDNATSEPANLWQSILNEALYDASKAGPEKHLLLLGMMPVLEPLAKTSHCITSSL
jgi:hypothetical protein